MPWDLALDATGDLIFSPTHDLLGATGDGLTQQRIQIRCRIPRGSWQYDEDGTLGSQLNLISRNPSQAQLAAAPAAIREALQPMTYISVDDVQVYMNDSNQISAAISYTPAAASADDEEATVIDDALPTIDATVTF